MSRCSLPVAMLLAALAGCGRHSEGRSNHGDCNPTGCFGCTDSTQTNCWPLPYDPCRSNADCHPGATCTNVGCCSGCHSDGDCRDGEVCTAAGYCAPGKAATTPVHGGPDGGAQDVPAAGPGVIPCALDAQCNPGEACVGGQCTHGASCGIPAVLCAREAECGASRTCSGGLCRAVCHSASDCPIGQHCSSSVCFDGAGTHGCVLDAECGPAYRCINATCHPLCAKDSQCGRQEFCDSGVCRADPRPTRAQP